MSTTYTVDPTKIASYKRASIRNTVLIYGPVILLGVALANRGNFSPSGLISMAGGGLFGALVIGLLVWSSVRTLERQAATLRITLDDETITREAAQGPAMTLRLNAITLIEEYPGMGLTLRTDDPQARLYLPELLGEFPTLHALLVARSPVARKTSPGRRLLQSVVGGLLPVVLMVALWTVPSRPFVILIGAVIVCGAAGLALYIRRNANLPRWYRLMAWLSVPLMLVLMLQRLNALP